MTKGTSTTVTVIISIAISGCLDESAREPRVKPKTEDRGATIEVETENNSSKPDRDQELAIQEGNAHEVSGPSNIQEQKTTVGFRNFSQLRYTMAALTGIDPHGNANIRNAYSELRTQLPGNNNIREITPAKVAAVNKLGAAFCDELMRSDANRSALFPTINFDAAPSVAFANPDAFAEQLIAKFWGVDPKANDVKDKTKLLSQLIAELTIGRGADAAQTPNIAMGACTAAISSTAVTTY